MKIGLLAALLFTTGCISSGVKSISDLKIYQSYKIHGSPQIEAQQCTVSTYALDATIADHNGQPIDARLVGHQGFVCGVIQCAAFPSQKQFDCIPAEFVLPK